MLGSTLVAVVSLSAAPIPMADLIKPFEFSWMTLSPDGKHLGVVVAGPTNESLMTVELSTRRRRIALSTVDIRAYSWISPERLLVAYSGTGPIRHRACTVGHDGSQRRTLFLGSGFPRVLSSRPEDSPYVLLECRGLQEHTPHLETTVSRLNVLDDGLSIEVKDPGSVQRYFVDSEGQVRLAHAAKEERQWLWYRPNLLEKWRKVYEATEPDKQVVPVGFAAGDQEIYVAGQLGQDTVGLHLLDPATKSIRERVSRREGCDLDRVFQIPTSTLLGFGFEAERYEIQWVDPWFGTLQTALDKVLPGPVKMPINQTPDRELTLLFAYGDRVPGTYYVYHRQRNELELFADVAPWLRAEDLSEMRPVRYQARDGMEIPAYLTLPVGKPPTNLPLVVMPHGGPWTRDEWGFEATVQFLASRGYAVLQPNFRGSTGYGLAFERAGYREYGTKMQDDITDGVRWAIQQGTADPGRIAIFGASFGGYAAMIGLTQTPELYRCGINYAGIADVGLFLRRRAATGSKRAQEFARIAVMDYRHERQALKDISPVYHVEHIRAPVLLVYGGADRIVSMEQARKLEKELKRHQKTYEMIFEEEEGHGFRKPENVVRLFDRIEAFLAEHLQ